MKSGWLVLVIIALSACNRTDRILGRLERATDLSPREVLRGLDSVYDVEGLGRKDRCRYEYLRAKACYDLKRLHRRDTQLVKPAVYFEDKGNMEQAAFLMLCAGRAYQKAEEYEQAANCYLEAETLAKKSDAKSLLLNIYYEYGHLCSKLNDRESMILWFERMINLVKEQPDMLEHWKGGNLFLNIGSALLYLGKEKEALRYFQKVSQYTMNLADSSIVAMTSLKIAYLLQKQKRWQEARKYIDKTLMYNVNKEIKLNAKLLEANSYRQDGEYDSLAMVLKSIKGMFPVKRDEEEQRWFYELCVESYLNNGNHEKALECFRNYTTFVEGKLIPRAAMRMEDFRHRYKQKKMEMQYLRARNRELLIYCWGGLVLVVVGLAGYIFYRQSRLRQQRCIEMEDLAIKLNALLCARTRKLQEMVENDLQFTCKLAKVRGSMSEKDSTFARYFDKMFAGGRFDSKEIYKAVDLLYAGFNTRLVKTYPDLNGQEVELCCMLRAGFDTKDIALMTEQSVYTIQKRRSTIRKKLNTEEGENIIAFLERALPPAESGDLLSGIQPLR